MSYIDFFSEHTFELELLGVGIRDIVVREGDDGETYIYTSTSFGGGVVAYRLNADGEPDIVDMEGYSGASRIPLTNTANIITIDDKDYFIVAASGGSSMAGYQITSSGGIGNRYSVDWGPVDIGSAHIEFMTVGGRTFIATASEYGSGLSFYEMETNGDTISIDISGNQESPIDTVAAMDSVSIDGTTYLLTASTEQDEIVSFKVDSGTGTLIEVSDFGTENGLGINAPTGMEIVSVAGNTYVIVAASSSNSLSVLRLNSDGTFEAVDHVLDTTHTRFEEVGQMESFTVGDQVFLLVSGSDNGVTLMTVLPNGTLQHVETLTWNGSNGLDSISAIEVAKVGSEYQIFIASGTGEALFQFSFDSNSIGTTQTGTASNDNITGTNKDDIIAGGFGNDTLKGGDGDDTLVDDFGADTFWGGNGVDTFVMAPDASTDVIMDFDRGVDVLDLSNYGMLYSAGQITVQSTSTGAYIEFRGDIFEIYSDDGYSLSSSD